MLIHGEQYACTFRFPQVKKCFPLKLYNVSPKKVDAHAELIRRAERGGRVAEIRQATGYSGAKFAEELNKLAVAYSYPTRFDVAKISKMESGVGRGLSVEEGALLAVIDPLERGIAWLAFGGPAIKSMRGRRGGNA